MTHRQDANVAMELLQKVDQVLGGFGVSKSAAPSASDVWFALTLATAAAKDDRLSSNLEATLRRWFGSSRELSADKRNAVLQLVRDADASAYDLGRAFEMHLAGTASTERRDRGAYFTPENLARGLVRQVLGSVLRSVPNEETFRQLAILDPSAGTGAFAFPVLDLLSAKLAKLSDPAMSSAALRNAVLQNNLYMVDVDPLTVAVLRSLLWIDGGCDAHTASMLEAHVTCLDSVQTPLDTARSNLPSFAKAFSDVMSRGGFDAVIGNPPWGALRPSASHASYDNEKQRKSQSTKRADYARKIKDLSSYTLQGKGDADLYRYFVERAIQLLRSGGQLGLVIPGAFMRAEGAAPLRAYMFEAGTFESITEMTNASKVFDIHTMFRFIQLHWKQGRPEGLKRLTIEGHSGHGHASKAVRLSKSYLKRVSGYRMSVPDVRSSRAADLLLKLSSRHPLLGEYDASTWNVRYTRELDVTAANERFIRTADAVSSGAQRRADGTWTHPSLGRLMPLFEGRMVHQHDAFAKAHRAGTGRSAVWDPQFPTDKLTRPQYLVPELLWSDLRIPSFSRAGFCDVTGHANERTVLAALIPSASVAGNKVPTLRFEGSDEFIDPMWVAIANSFIVDWIARRRVSTTLNFFQLEQISFPRLDPTSAIGQELSELGGLLSSWSSSISNEDQWKTRATWRARIEALVAHSYGIDLDDLARVLEDFPLLDGARFQSLRTQTRDATLAAFAEYEGISGVRLTDLGISNGGGPDSLDERVQEQRNSDLVAFLPTEFMRFSARALLPVALPLLREGKA